MTEQKQELLILKRNIKEFLPVPLTDKEQIEYGRDMRMRFQEKLNLENHLKATSDTIKKSIKEKESEMMRLNDILENGSQDKLVECSIAFDIKEKRALITRLDTNDIVTNRPMTQAEKDWCLQQTQLKLFPVPIEELPPPAEPKKSKKKAKDNGKAEAIVFDSDLVSYEQAQSIAEKNLTEPAEKGLIDAVNDHMAKSIESNFLGRGGVVTTEVLPSAKVSRLISGDGDHRLEVSLLPAEDIEIIYNGVTKILYKENYRRAEKFYGIDLNNLEKISIDTWVELFGNKDLCSDFPEKYPENYAKSKDPDAPKKAKKISQEIKANIEDQRKPKPLVSIAKKKSEKKKVSDK